MYSGGVRRVRGVRSNLSISREEDANPSIFGEAFANPKYLEQKKWIGCIKYWKKSSFWQSEIQEICFFYENAALMSSIELLKIFANW